jgi:hypothetical protein
MALKNIAEKSVQTVQMNLLKKQDSKLPASHDLVVKKPIIERKLTFD